MSCFLCVCGAWFREGRLQLQQAIFLLHSLIVLNLLTASRSYITGQRSSSTRAHLPQVCSLLPSDTGIRVGHSLQPDTWWKRWKRHSTRSITSEFLATVPLPSSYPCPSSNDARLLRIFQEPFSPFSFFFHYCPHKNPQENGHLSRMCILKVPYPPQELKQTTKNEAIPGHSLFICCRFVRW